MPSETLFFVELEISQNEISGRFGDKHLSHGGLIHSTELGHRFDLPIEENVLNVGQTQVAKELPQILKNFVFEAF